MADTFISCDWGTSNFRLRMVLNGAVIREVCNDQGVANLNSPGEFQAVLQDSMAALGAEAPVRVLISGMASSSIGWKELPYAGLPFSLDAGDLVLREVAEQVILISGVRGECDVMRGEEVELLGLVNIPDEAIAIFPGTHSKHCHLRHGKLIGFSTFMTGELHAVLSMHSVLRHSVAPGWDEAAFAEGIETSRRMPLTRALFGVRARTLLDKKNPVANSSYLSGLLIGAELAALPADLPLMLAAAGSLGMPYRMAVDMLGFANRTQVLPDEEVKSLAVRGHMKVLEAYPG